MARHPKVTIRFTETTAGRLAPPDQGEAVYWDALLPDLDPRIPEWAQDVDRQHQGQQAPARPLSRYERRRGAHRRPCHAGRRAAARTSRRAGAGAGGARCVRTDGRAVSRARRTASGQGAAPTSLAAYTIKCGPTPSRWPACRSRPSGGATSPSCCASSRGTTARPPLRSPGACSRVSSATWLRSTWSRRTSPTVRPSFDLPRSRVFSDAELAALWAATHDDLDLSSIIRILLWIGCRRSEAAGMRWSELQNGVWCIPGSRTKNHRTLMLPLPRQMVAALERLAQDRRPRSPVRLDQSSGVHVMAPEGPAGRPARLRSVMAIARLQKDLRDPADRARRQPRDHHSGAGTMGCRPCSRSTIITTMAPKSARRCNPADALATIVSQAQPAVVQLQADK